MKKLNGFLWGVLLAIFLFHTEVAYSGARKKRLGEESNTTQKQQATCDPSRQPRSRALLVGAHEYQSLPGSLHLRGPQNDVRLIENALKPLGFDVQVVTDGRATKSNVVSTWDEMTEEAQCGDQVFLMLSGHGTDTAKEGWIFLFEDTKVVSGAGLVDVSGTWSDKEIYESIVRLRARKVNVTLLIDAANSEGARLFTAPHANNALTSDQWNVVPEDYGALTVLYAYGIPPEIGLPAGRPDRKSYGLFSYLVGQALATNIRSVRDLVAHINEQWTPVSGDKRRLKTNFASTHPDLPLFHAGMAMQSSGTEVMIDSSDGKPTRGGARVTGSMVTGRLQPTDGLLDLRIAGRAVTNLQPNGRFQVEIPLKRGDNEIDIVAMYANRPHLVRSMTVHSTGGQWQAERPAQSYALLIANERYDKTTSGFDPLKTPKADADKLAQELRTRYGFRTGLPRSDGSERPLILYNANRADIFRALDDIARESTPDDAVFVFYAGHGKQLKTALPNGSAFVKTYWVPSNARADNGDADWVSADDINTKIARIRARHVLLVSDSCYAGSLNRSGDDSISLQKAEPDRYLSEMSRKPSRYLLASGGNHPVDDGQGNSPFAQALLSVLRNPPAPAFTLQQVFPELQKRVSNTTNQTPEFPPLRGDAGAAGDGGAMVFFQN